MSVYCGVCRRSRNILEEKSMMNFNKNVASAPLQPPKPMVYYKAGRDRRAAQELRGGLRLVRYEGPGAARDAAHDLQ